MARSEDAAVLTTSPTSDMDRLPSVPGPSTRPFPVPAKDTTSMEWTSRIPLAGLVRSRMRSLSQPLPPRQSSTPTSITSATTASGSSSSRSPDRKAVPTPRARSKSILKQIWTTTRRLSGVEEEEDDKDGVPGYPDKQVRIADAGPSTPKKRARFHEGSERKKRSQGHGLKGVIGILVLAAIYIALRRRPADSLHLQSQSSVDATRTRGVIEPRRTNRSGRKTSISQAHDQSSGKRASLPAEAYGPTVHDTYTIQDGLLRPDFSAQTSLHPIYHLMRDARDAWDDKVARQSRTLRDAVDEYKDRYGLEPPKGFDKWWAYAEKHSVQLPDEYDQIHDDILPFRAFSPSYLRSSIAQASKVEDTYSLFVKDGVMSTSEPYDPNDKRGSIVSARERMNAQMELLKEVADNIPDMQVVYSVHDTPSVVISRDYRQELLRCVVEGRYCDDLDVDRSKEGWQHACPPSAPIHRHQPMPRTIPHDFITSHSSLMNICSSPRTIGLHGLLAGKSPQMAPLLPVFTLSKTNLHADILGVPNEQWVKDIRHIPWKEKVKDELLWRGSNTGSLFRQGERWWNSHRIRFVRMANEINGDTEVLMAPSEMKRGNTSMIGQARKLVKNEELKEWMDVKFTREPCQCDAFDGTCQELAEEFDFVPLMTHDQALSYKYIFDMDGNAWSARFQRLLMGNALVFKSTITPEWYTDRIQPWVHYVPIQVGYSDLYDSLAFFRDPLSVDLAEQIANEGRSWAKAFWRKEDMVAYAFRLYLEWARLLAEDREGMDFVYDGSMEV